MINPHKIAKFITNDPDIFVETKIQDYGTRYLNQRNLITKITRKIDELKHQLAQTQNFPDLIDLETDKDRTNGSKYIKKAIKNLQKQLKPEKIKLKELAELWDLTRTKIGEE